MIALVIGDVALDRRTEGVVAKMSREAPVPVIEQTNLVENLGWAGGTASNIVAMGHQCLLLGCIGDDHDGDRVERLCQEQGIEYCLPRVASHTPVKHRLTSGGQILSRFDTNYAIPRFAPELSNGLQALEERAEQLSIIVISDNGNNTVTPEFMHDIKTFAHRHSLPIFVDCRADSINKYRGVSLVKPNMPDALKMLDGNVDPGLAMDNSPVDQLTSAVRELHKTYEIPLVVVTHGPHGCAYIDPTLTGPINQQICFHDAVGPHDGSNVRDICGAGDATMAALTVGYMEGMDVMSSVNLAMNAAGYVVQFYGIKKPTRGAVERFKYEHTGWAAKIMTQAQAMQFIRWYNETGNYSLVITNGCFDGLHSGHIETLRYAKRQGDLLLVAYNDDDSIKALKGDNRPTVPDSYRASHLAQQAPVDIVIRFNGDVEALVKMFKPAVMVKGEDAKAQYTKLPGADYVASYGGRVEFCPINDFYIVIDREKGFSS